MLKKIFAAFLAAVALVGFGSNAWADDQTIDMLDYKPGQAWLATRSIDWSNTFTGNGGYDTLTFVISGAPAGTYTVAVAIVGNFLSTLSEGTLTAGQASQSLDILNLGPYFAFGQASLQNVFIEDGQFRVTYTGPYSDGLDVYAHAERTSVSAVPEPETYATLLAGLVAVGFVAFRNRIQRN